MRRVPDRLKRYFKGALGLRTLVVVFLLVWLAGPLAALARDALRGGWDVFWDALTLPSAAAAIKLTLGTAAATAALNTVMGTIIAYTLVHYEFPGRRALNALIDVPFAVPGVAAGAALVILLGPRGGVGRWEGVVAALLFVSLPLVVRAVQPVLLEMGRGREGAFPVGASEADLFFRVVLPRILPAVAAGAVMTFALAVGEFAAVVLVSGNIPLRTETVAVYALGEIECDNPVGAGAVSVLMIAASVLLGFLAEAWFSRRPERAC